MSRLDRIIDALDKYHQRATYGAVGALAGKPARFVMQGRPKDWRHSWVVSDLTGLPSAYPDSKVHPSILEREEIFDNAEDLAGWLDEPS
jgi:hypothetical protein